MFVLRQPILYENVVFDAAVAADPEYPSSYVVVASQGFTATNRSPNPVELPLTLAAWGQTEGTAPLTIHAVTVTFPDNTQQSFSEADIVAAAAPVRRLQRIIQLVGHQSVRVVYQMKFGVQKADRVGYRPLFPTVNLELRVKLPPELKAFATWYHPAARLPVQEQGRFLEFDNPQPGQYVARIKGGLLPFHGIELGVDLVLT